MVWKSEGGVRGKDGEEKGKMKENVEEGVETEEESRWEVEMGGEGPGDARDKGAVDGGGGRPGRGVWLREEGRMGENQCECVPRRVLP